jgi:hypothetical protein
MSKRRTKTAQRRPGGNSARNRLKAQERFLRQFEKLGTIVHAADKAKVGRRTHYQWLEEDPTYPERFAHAEEIAIQTLERELYRRAHEGVDEPVFYQGAVCGVVRKYSDSLLMFALKAKRRSIYADRHEHTGADGKPLQPEPSKMSTAEIIAEVEAIIGKAKKLTS